MLDRYEPHPNQGWKWLFIQFVVQTPVYLYPAD